jgi:hypothetical protein
MKTVETLSLCELASLFGADPQEIETFCGKLLNKITLRYQTYSSHERDQCLLKILHMIDSPDIPAAGENRQPEWEKGWRENLDIFIQARCNPDALIPKYYKKRVPLRLNGEIVKPISEDLVYHVTHLFRTWLFLKYFQPYDSIHEFGCGSGFHIGWLASLFPQKEIYGLDWATASQEILDFMRNEKGWRVQGKHFNFFEPSKDHKISDNSAVLTFGALEQVGSRFSPFLDYLLMQSPKLVVNVECLHELYDENHLLDYLALRYHHRRNYLHGYLTRLKALEQQGRIKIIQIHKQSFGNMYNDTHSFVVWKPINTWEP